MHYKHTQIGYLMIVITIAVLTLFGRAHITSSLEPPSVDSGTNLGVTGTMAIILCILISFVSLQVSIDEKNLHLKFGYGIYKRSFLLADIQSAKSVKNHRYYGRGIRVWFWPKMRIYNVSGFDAVEITLKNGRIYRIGTDEAQKLEKAIHKMIRK